MGPEGGSTPFVPRRRFLAGALAGLATSGLTGGCRSRPPPTREGTLSALVREVLVPATRDVVATSGRLADAVAALERSPSAGALRKSRAQWTLATLSWKRVECLRSGPFVDSSALARVLYWPLRAGAVEALLARETPVDDRAVEELGADLKGLFALESLLFPAGLDDRAATALFQGGDGTRRRALAAAYARAVSEHALTASELLGNGSSYAARLASGAGESLSLVVGEIVRTLDTLAVERLDSVIVLDKNQKLVPSAVEGGPSHTSHELVRAQFLASDRVYRGGRSGGIADLVAAASKRQAERVEQRLDAVHEALRPLTEPLESLVRRDRPRLVALVGALKMLEITFKLEVVSTLGLTLNFRGADGD